MYKYLICSIYFLLSFSSSVYSQKIKLIQSEGFKGGTRGSEAFNKFIGDVIFEHGRTRIYCDSALFFRDRNFVEAYGHVRIIEGDSIDIVARKLIYNGNNNEALLRKM